MYQHFYEFLNGHSYIFIYQLHTHLDDLRNIISYSLGSDCKTSLVAQTDRDRETNRQTQIDRGPRQRHIVRETQRQKDTAERY